LLPARPALREPIAGALDERAFLVTYSTIRSH
jgi:hypothetical protein